jgi:energy-coupling factor transporter transmembrane protein EcfT
MEAAVYPRRPHPVASLVCFVGTAVEIGAVQSWLALVISTALVLWLVKQAARERESIWFLVRASVPLLLFYTLIGCWFAQPGDHILLQGPHVKYLGTLAISLESLGGTLFRAIRFWGILLLMAVLGSVTDAEDVAQWFGRRYSRVGITVAMVVRFIPGLLEERARIAELVRVRGAVDAHAARFHRIRAQVVVYQTLLMNALERSWAVAESMFVRGYGAGRRTLYAQPRWRREDVVVTAGAITVMTVACVQMWMARVQPALPMTPLEVAMVLGAATLVIWMGVKFRG